MAARRFYAYDENGLPMASDSIVVAAEWISRDLTVLDTEQGLDIMGLSGQQNSIKEYDANGPL